MISIKRVYDHPSLDDGYRVLVDRLWPRGLTREAAAIAEWAKDVAPSPELRKWFASDQVSWPEFQRRYRLELTRPDKTKALADLLARARSGNVTLLIAKRDTEQNSAAVLREVLEGL